jgi:hypothetical protein
MKPKKILYQNQGSCLNTKGVTFSPNSREPTNKRGRSGLRKNRGGRQLSDVDIAFLISNPKVKTKWKPREDEQGEGELKKISPKK